MNDKRKIQLELANFGNFIHLGKIPFDRYESHPPPEPDIVAWRAEIEFGIEITNFHWPAEKRRESEEDLVLERAFNLYSSRDGPSLQLSIMWAPHFKIDKKNREEIAGKIALLAQRNSAGLSQWLTLDWRNFDHLLMGAVDHIALLASPKGVPAH